MLGLQSNALKFTHSGDVHIKVSVEDNFLKIAVEDTGIGISEVNKKKLFQMFGFLEESASVNQNGVGLGLVIS